MAKVMMSGLVAVPLGAEVVAEPAERADHLVGDEQHAVAVADLAHPLEVAGRRREAAAGVLHRLQVDRGHRRRALAEDGALDLVGRPPPERLQRVAVLGRAVEVRVRHAYGPGHQRLEGVLDVGQAGDRQRAHRRAVVRDLAADHLVPAVLAGQLEVVAGQLERRLDGLGAAGGEEDPVEVARARGSPAARPARWRSGARRTTAGSRPARRPAARRPRRARAARARSGRRTARTARPGTACPCRRRRRVPRRAR